MLKRHAPKLRSNRCYADPWRQLLAAVVLQAVRDACFPSRRTPRQDRRSAWEFLADRRTEDLFAELGLPWDRVQSTLAKLKEAARDDNSISVRGQGLRSHAALLGCDAPLCPQCFEAGRGFCANCPP